MTLAAGALVGAAALAGIGRKRRAGAQLRDRRLGLRRHEPLAPGLQRMALAQADLAIELLDAGSDPHAVHETRKALKRLRALLRLLRGALGEERYARDSAALREAGRSLSGVRDAEATLAAFDALVQRHPRKLAGRRGVGRLRARLAAEHERAQRHTLGNPATLARVLGELRLFRTRAAAWQLDGTRGVDLVAEDLRALYRQGRRRGRRAARRGGGDALAMHQWRKRVKDLRYAAEMLGRRGLAKRADELGETLGEDHDLAVLADWIRTSARAGPRGQRAGRRTRKQLLALIAKRRRKLQRRALRDGRRLYEEPPKQFLRRISRALSPR